MKFAYLGPKGTYSESALWSYVASCDTPKEIVVPVPVASISGLVDNLVKGEVTLSVIPWENSTEGVVTEAIDALTASDSIQIVGEILLPVAHVLFSKQNLPLNTLTDIISHPQVLAQCHHFLRTYCPQARLHSWASSAAAAQSLQDGALPFLKPGTTPHIGVIGDLSLGSLFSLTPLATSIQDNPENVTRFLILGTTQPTLSPSAKTTVVFTTKRDVPGSLYHALGVFAQRSINLTSISSRPEKKSLGDYLFCIDIEGHRELPQVAEALVELQNYSSFIKVLGTYPSYQPKGDRS